MEKATHQIKRKLDEYACSVEPIPIGYESS